MDDMSIAADQLRALLLRVESGELDASVALTAYLAGALASLEAQRVYNKRSFAVQ